MNRRGFTLVELLITIVIIGMMAAMVLFAMLSAQESAKVKKTEALIAKIDAVLKNKWESYQTRRVPIDTTGLTSAVAARRRLDALRDLMRLELPDRWSDVVDDPATPFGVTPKIARPSVSQAYKRRYDARMAAADAPTLGQAQEFQGAECLYLIIQAALQEEGDDVTGILRPDNIGDKDGDGFPEIVDAWKTPIRFLRWAPGFVSELQTAASGAVSDNQTDPAPPPQTSQLATFDALIDFGMMPVPPTAGPLSRGLSTRSGEYVGGAVVPVLSTGVAEFDKISRITGYQYFPLQASPARPAFVRFTCSTPSYTQQKAFPNGGPTSAFIVLPPDPFDPAGVYPVYNPGNPNPPSPTDTSRPTFALYPLIYSAGPDKAYGVVGEYYSNPNDETTALRYSSRNVDPFFIPPNSEPMGFQKAIPAERGDWKDNIHNHMMGLR